MPGWESRALRITVFRQNLTEIYRFKIPEKRSTSAKRRQRSIRADGHLSYGRVDNEAIERGAKAFTA